MGNDWNPLEALVNLGKAAQQLEAARRAKLPAEEQRRLRRQDLLIDVKDTAIGLLAVTPVLAFWSLPLVAAYMLGRRNRTR